MCVVYFYFILFIYFNNHFLIAYIYNYIYNNTRKKKYRKRVMHTPTASTCNFDLNFVKLLFLKAIFRSHRILLLKRRIQNTSRLGGLSFNQD